MEKNNKNPNLPPFKTYQYRRHYYFNDFDNIIKTLLLSTVAR